jgi:hypothetical protein
MLNKKYPSKKLAIKTFTGVNLSEARCSTDANSSSLFFDCIADIYEVHNLEKIRTMSF